MTTFELNPIQAGAIRRMVSLDLHMEIERMLEFSQDSAAPNLLGIGDSIGKLNVLVERIQQLEGSRPVDFEAPLEYVRERAKEALETECDELHNAATTLLRENRGLVTVREHVDRIARLTDLLEHPDFMPLEDGS